LLLNNQGLDYKHLNLNYITNLKDAVELMKYLVTMASGRDFVLNSGYDVYETAYEAYEEACLHDDYLVNVEPIDE